ncbi:MAG: inositol monophosphatase [Spirochaetaceae bacterium]|nr:inositol monophosphatase [Spirochaetaceae bacterium]
MTGVSGMDDPGSWGNLLEIALDAAAAAARHIVEDRPRGPLEVTATKSSVTDIVTVMDQQAERLVVERIRAGRPEDGFLGEEGAAVEGTSGVTWVIDPIDGTVNYLYEIPSYAVSVAARVGDQVVAGAVVNAVSGETWSATRGRGAWLDGRPIRVNAAPELAMALVATGFGYGVARRARQARILGTVLPRVRDVRRAGAASLDLCALACGRLDAFYEQGLQPWDLAAGGLVAEEAGATVGGLQGRPAGEAMVLAAPPGLFDEMAALLAELAADEMVEG